MTSNADIFSNRLAIWQRVIYNQKVGVRLNDTESSKYHDSIFKFNRYLGEEDERESENNLFGYSKVVNYKELYQNQKERFMLKYLRFIDSVVDKTISNDDFNKVLSKEEIVEGKEYILVGLFYLASEYNEFKPSAVMPSSVVIPFSNKRLINIFVERKDTETFVIKEIAFQENRQKVVELIRLENNKKIEDEKAKILLFNRDILSNDGFFFSDIVKGITINLNESQNQRHYLFTNGAKQVNLDQKILNILCPFKVLYEYKKLRLEPPLYWCYRFKKVLSTTTNQYGVFQLALSRLQNKWCRGTSIFNTILLMRYFMLSFYILADDKPVLLSSSENSEENIEKFFKNETFLEASAKINQGIGIEDQYDDTENTRLNELYKEKPWPDITLSTIFKDIIQKSISSILSNNSGVINSNVPDEDEDSGDKTVDMVRIKNIFIKFLNTRKEDWKELKLNLDDWLKLFDTRTNKDPTDAQNLWDAIPIEASDKNESLNKIMSTLDNYNELDAMVKNKKDDLRKALKATILTLKESILDKWDTVANEFGGIGVTKVNFEKINNTLINQKLFEGFQEIVSKLKIKYDTVRELEISLSELLDDSVEVEQKIISNENLLNLYRSLVIYKETGKSIFFTSGTYFRRLKSYLYENDDNDDSDMSFMLLYARAKVLLDTNTDTYEKVGKIFKDLTAEKKQIYKQDDLYYIYNNNLVEERLRTEKRVDSQENIVSNQVAEFIAEAQFEITTTYKYICDTFLKPSFDEYNDYNNDANDADVLILLKVMRDSLIYLIEKYDSIPKGTPSVKVFEDRTLKVTELDYVFSKVFECYTQTFAQIDVSDPKEKEVKILCHVFLCLYYKNKILSNYTHYSSRIKNEFKINDNDITEINQNIYAVLLYVLNKKYENTKKTKLVKKLEQQLGIDGKTNKNEFIEYSYFWLIMVTNKDTLEQFSKKVGTFFETVEKIITNKNVSKKVKTFLESKDNITSAASLLEFTKNLQRRRDMQLDNTSKNRQIINDFNDLKFPELNDQEIIDAIKIENDKLEQEREEQDLVPYDENNSNDELDLLRKQRFDLVDEMNALFISAKAKLRKETKIDIAANNFKVSEASFRSSSKNFLDYIVKNDPTPQSTIENMLNGYIEYVSHGIDLNNEANIQTFYGQTYKQFFQTMALKANRLKKQDQISKNISKINIAQRQATFKMIKDFLLARYQWEPFYMKKDNHYLCQSKRFDELSKTSKISFAHDIETFETVSLTYDKGFQSVHYQNYKIDNTNIPENFVNLDVSSAQEYVYLKYNDVTTSDIDKKVEFKEEDNVVGRGIIKKSITGENFDISDTTNYIKIEITSGYCPDEGKLIIIIDEETNEEIDIGFNDDFKASLEEDERKISNVLARTISPYQVFLKKGTSVVFPTKDAEKPSYFIVRHTNKVKVNTDAEILYEMVKLDQRITNDDDAEEKILTTFSDIRKTNPYVLYFCNYVFMKQKNSFVFNKDFFSSDDDKNTIKAWEESGLENQFIDNDNVQEEQQKTKLAYNYEKIVLLPNAITVKYGTEAGAGIVLDSINKKIEVTRNESLTLDKMFDVVVKYSAVDSVEELEGEFKKIARLFERYDKIIYNFRKEREESITVPFQDESDKNSDVYVIEYGTYEFLHHFFMGNLAKRNIFVKVQTKSNVIFKSITGNDVTVIPLYRYYRFDFNKDSALKLVNASSYENNQFLEFDSQFKVDSFLKGVFGYYEEVEQRYNSNFNDYSNKESDYASRVTCVDQYRTQLKNNKNYAAIKFGYNMPRDQYELDIEKGIQSHRKKFHKGQRFYDYLIGRRNDLVAFYKNSALSFNTTNLTDLSLFLHKNGGGYDNGKAKGKLNIRNLIYRNKAIVDVLKNNSVYNYGCLGIRRDLYETHKLEQGNFTYNSAMLKFGLPLVFHIKNNFERNNTNIFEETFEKDGASLSAEVQNAFSKKYKRQGNTNEQQLKSYFAKIYLNSRELESVKIQYRQALRKTELKYMDYCDYELFYNVFVAEIIEDTDLLRVKEGFYDAEEFSNVTSGNVKDRWPFFIRLALYEKYNYFLPMLQKNVNTPTFERLFKSEIILNRFREVQNVKHGKYEQWVYIYCLALTILLCE